jgi:hypothetical protein
MSLAFGQSDSLASACVVGMTVSDRTSGKAASMHVFFNVRFMRGSTTDPRNRWTEYEPEYSAPSIKPRKAHAEFRALEKLENVRLQNRLCNLNAAPVRHRLHGPIKMELKAA